MIYVHELVKIRISREGYLPDYPPHLISDEEMCDAFLKCDYSDDVDETYQSFQDSSDVSYFKDMYPPVHNLRCGTVSEDIKSTLEAAYKDLVHDIAYHIDKLLTSTEDEYQMPDWVYSYMIGETLSINSDRNDLHDMFVMLDCDNLDDEFNWLCALSCLRSSKEWLSRLSPVSRLHRPPTVFGEPHVLKYLRVKSLDVD